MELTGIEEQVRMKTKCEVNEEIAILMKPIYDFLVKNDVIRDATPFQVRTDRGTLSTVADSQSLYWKLRIYFTDLILRQRTQKALNEIVKKLME